MAPRKHTSSYAIRPTVGPTARPSATRPKGGALSCLVGDVDQFAASTWGQRAHLTTGDRSLHNLLSIGAVDSLIANGLRRPHFRVLRDGATLPASAVTRGVRAGGTMVDDFADPERIADQFAEGGTLVLQGLEHIRPQVADFAAELAAELGHRVQANAYLSPPQTAGLVPHTDAHDVFALQLFGRKTWTVDGLEEVVTERGDVLYIPAGVRHAARTDDSWSLHLTIGVHAIRVGGALRRAVQQLVADEPTMARPLAVAFAGSGRDLAVAQLRDARDELVALLNQLDVESLVDAESAPVRRRAASHVRLGNPGRVALLVSSTQLNADTLVVATTGTAVSTADVDSIHITGGRRVLTLPARVRPTVEHLLSGQPCIVGEVPGLDDESRLVLVRRLVAEGVVVATK